MEFEHFGIFSISGGSFASPLGRLHSQKMHPKKKSFADRVAALPPGVRNPEKRSSGAGLWPPTVSIIPRLPLYPSPPPHDMMAGNLLI